MDSITGAILSSSPKYPRDIDLRNFDAIGNPVG